MAVEANSVASLFEKLKVDDPWVPPKPWESVPAESGCFSSESKSQSSHSLYHISSLSESSLVRLAMNALQGVESALITVDKLSGLFCSDSADRTFHRISNLWTRSSSTLALGNLLKSVGQFGSIVFLLHKFVDYFMRLNPNGSSGLERNPCKDYCESKELPECKFSLVNQAFAVAVKKVVDGYISALNTLCASVSMRRTLKNGDVGCLMDVGNAEITLLEVYLHTKGLRVQMEALGNICHISDIALGFSVSSFEGLIDKADPVFASFPKGASLLTFIYTQLKVVDPVYCALLKFLFLQSCEPYFGFIKSWIYEGRISDPYEEFVVEYVENLPAYALGNSEISIDFPLNTVRVRDGVTLPYFLEEFLTPLLRAGQQLQVVIKLLELCNNLGTCNITHEEILPFLDDISCEYPFLMSALTFQKGNIDDMLLVRKSYYERLQEKVEKILAKFEFRSQQASLHNIQLLYAMNHGRNPHYDSLVDNSLIPPVIDGRDENRAITDSDNEIFEDESFSAEDFLESSESAEQNEFEEMWNSRRGPEPSSLSSLSFSFSSSADQLAQKPFFPHLAESISSEIWQKAKDSCEVMDTYHERTDITYNSLPHQFGEPKVFCFNDSECTDDQNEVGLQFACVLDDHSCVDGGGGNNRVAWLDLTGSLERVKSKTLEVWKTDASPSSDTISSGNVSTETAYDKNQHSDGSSALPNQSNERSWGSRYNSKFLSANPILSKGHFFNYCNKAGESYSVKYREPLSYFDFTSVRDPLKVCEKKLASGPRQRMGAEFPILADMVNGDAANVNGSCSKEGCGDENNEKSKEKTKSSCFPIPSNSKAGNLEGSLHGKITGGSGWETLLAHFRNPPGITTNGYRNVSAAVFEMPLDYVIEKCLWEQILLQYKYISKLTIKLLEEGFDLQEHLMALRRYHFMEVADWADLFIMSLWHHKWYVAEADKRIPEIQGVLELSVRRSSCEGDPKKDRLYVYMKRDCVMPLSTSAIGVHAFDFLGLGYRVDWPVSIILTPGALKIYSDIFSFLIQVKLAVFSLSDMWCSLKDLVQLTKRNRRLELPKLALHRICLLTETRHQVNHFVSTLQQYVQSQLSHVSWCKFLNSLKHKVKDMMDLEAVHMAYLTESLQICFLSDETRPIASVIQTILQIAMDLRSCLIGHSMEVGPSGEETSCELSRIDIAQVLSTKKRFTENLNDLYLCYLKSPKHAEYGLSHFWDYLNGNEYCSEIIDKQLGRHVLPF